MQEGHKTKNVLVVGMGSYAFGLEKRAVTMLRHMQRVRPYFLVSKYQDGSVDALLDRYGFEYEHVPLGYLGRAKPIWTLITLSQMPWLYYKFIRRYYQRKCAAILILNIHPLINVLLPILFLRYFSKANIVPYFGDILPKKLAYRILAQIMNRLAHRFIVNSRAMKENLVRLGVDKDNIKVIFNGVELDKFADAKSAQFHRMFFWQPISVLVGYLGQFTEHKGVWDFVKAAELVLQQEGNCRFLMIGKIGLVDCQRKIQEYIALQGLEEHIVFSGWMDNVEDAYAAIDIVVVPSRHEDSAPNVNIEAMASGVPVVSTRVGGIPELVVDGKTGLLVERENPDQIAECILCLVRDGELRKRMGRAGREWASQMFDVKKNVCLVEDVLVNG